MRLARLEDLVSAGGITVSSSTSRLRQSATPENVVELSRLISRFRHVSGYCRNHREGGVKE